MGNKFELVSPANMCFHTIFVSTVELEFSITERESHFSYFTYNLNHIYFTSKIDRLLHDTKKEFGGWKIIDDDAEDGEPGEV